MEHELNHKMPSQQDIDRLEGKWSKLTFADNYVFGEVLASNLEVCQRLLEAVLEIPIDHVEVSAAERGFEPSPSSKGVRLDVYAKDGSGRVFDVEMQRSNATDLVKRARYYQAAMDTGQLGKGLDYGRLSDSYVIFFCTFDPFGYGLKRYTYRRVCVENEVAMPWDGTEHVFLNATGTVGTVNDALQDVLDYLAGDNAEQSELVRAFNRPCRGCSSHLRRGRNTSCTSGTWKMPGEKERQKERRKERQRRTKR